MDQKEQEERRKVLEHKMRNMIQGPHYLTGGCLTQDLSGIGMCRITFVEETPTYNEEKLTQVLGVVCDYRTVEFIRDACNNALEQRTMIMRTASVKPS